MHESGGHVVTVTVTVTIVLAGKYCNNWFSMILIYRTQIVFTNCNIDTVVLVTFRPCDSELDVLVPSHLSLVKSVDVVSLSPAKKKG